MKRWKINEFYDKLFNQKKNRSIASKKKASGGIHSLNECSLQAALEKQKKNRSIASKKKASFLFGSSLTIHSFFVLLYLGWESNPHDLAITGF